MADGSVNPGGHAVQGRGGAGSGRPVDADPRRRLAASDGDHYLRLVARDPANNQRVSAPQKVKVDNTQPPTPVIQLQLKTPNGDLKDLKCGKVKKSDGLIRITIQASDPNFSQCSVADPPGVGPAVPLSKKYNYNVAETGYPALTS